MMKIQYVIKLANYFYKVAAEEEILEERSISPYSPYYKEDLGEEEEYKDLPSLKTFREQFQETTFNYRVIFLNNLFNLSKLCKNNDKKSITIEEYKTSIKNLVNSLSSKPRGLLSEELAKTLDEGNYLLLEDNFNRFFSKDAINVVVHKIADTDSVNAQAVIHDIGHKLMNEFTEKHLEFTGANFGKVLTEAITNDFNFEIVGNVRKSELDDVIDRIKGVMFELLLVSNNIISGSIGESNLMKDDVRDLFADLFLIFNKNKESLEGIKPLPVILYTNQYGNFISLRDKDAGGKPYPIRIYPKDPSGLPNIENILDDYLPKLDKFFKQELELLKGRVLPTSIGFEL